MISDEGMLATIAINAITKTLKEGAKKPRPCHWLDESQDMHLDKGTRHVSTFRLIRNGHQESNGENHLELALTRIAMAIAQECDR